MTATPRRMTCIRRREVADEIADGQCRMPVEVLANDAFVDPGAAALAGASEQVDVKAADRAAAVAYGVITDVVVPAGHVRLRFEAYAVEPLGKLEQQLANL